MSQGRRTRVLIVDDSAVMRSLLRGVIGSDPSLELVGAAADGESALGMIDSLRPDLALLDVEMPVMDGLATLRKLRARNAQMPVIMCSSLTRRGAAVTVEALAAGASDYVAKPAGQSNPAAATRVLAGDLLPKIKALTAGSAISAPLLPAARPVPSALVPQPSAQLPASTPAVVVIGVSTGGPAALDIILPSLPAHFPLPVLIVQHMPELFTRLLVERLGRSCPLRVVEAAEGNPVLPGAVYIARGNWHLEVLGPARTGQPPTIHLTQAPPENHCRPAVDVLFRSAATVYGGNILAVMLTGMGSDGLAGTRLIHARGGVVLAQDRASSAVWGMPGAVARAGLAHRIVPLREIAAEILRVTSRSSAEPRAFRETVAS
ncbi:MAG TPA: chemotaxis response regulator protein-glutamate methylesterase [Terracidiphilus sp.]|nr:chemotaxis response regulator protein-glutamate methylesterase [Terracidiphilus sp.]